MLKEEFEYFLAHQKELAASYRGKFIVIKNKEILGAYDTELEAVEQTSKKEKLGTFLVQKCDLDVKGLTQNFHSRVSFQQG